MIAYHNDAGLKARLIASLEEHRAADRIVSGHYWRNGTGCSVGCALFSLSEIEAAEKGDHGVLGERTGFGERLQRLNDSIFERLPKPQQQDWPIRFHAAAPVGADLSLVPWQFLERMLARAFARVPADSSAHKACAPALGIVSAKARGEPVVPYAAANAAANAAAYAGRAADAAAAARAADAAHAAAHAAHAAADAADAAAYAADAAAYARAAYTAAGAAAYAAARAAGAADAETVTQADDLCDLLAAAAPVKGNEA